MLKIDWLSWSKVMKIVKRTIPQMICFRLHFFLISLIPLNSPQGGPPPPPHLCARMLGDCHALKACICRAALLKAHGEMKAHILATICPDFAMNLKRWKETKGAQKTSNIFEKSVPKPFEIEAWSLQNRAKGHPKRNFSRHLTEESKRRQSPFEKIAIFSQFH